MFSITAFMLGVSEPLLFFACTTCSILETFLRLCLAKWISQYCLPQSTVPLSNLAQHALWSVSSTWSLRICLCSSEMRRRCGGWSLIFLLFLSVFPTMEK